MKLSILSVCLLAFLFTFSTQTFAATIVVNLTTDQSDFFIGDGLCDSNQVTSGNQCTLRAAIQEASFTTDLDNINFAIPGTGLQTIVLNSGLPSITNPVVIDGYTQPGASPNTLPVGNNAVFSIEIRQNGIGVNTFVISGGNSTLRGLLLNGGNTVITFNTNGGNHVEGCWFGLNPDGTANISIRIGVQSSGNNVIGGLMPEVRNVISNFSPYGIISNGSNEIIQNNYIGTDPTGTQKRTLPRPAIVVGIHVVSSSTIGGANPSARNVIAGLESQGILALGLGNTIQNNYIGIAADGMTPLSGGRTGIHARYGSTIISNLIGRFNEYGINLENAAAPPEQMLGNILRGNSIGMINDGSPAPIGSRGINIFNSNNIIGGTTGLTSGSCTGECNVIANYNKGIVITNAKNNQILGNSIHSNADIGIDLDNDGVTPNDVGDIDIGANDLQNFPFIDTVTSGSTRVTGRFFSTANRTFRLEFFNNPTVDASGYGEGQIYIGAINVTTGANGRADFDNTFTYNSPAGSFVTSTATDLTTLNTSEFSFAIQVLAPTAATVSVSGRVTARGRGISNAAVHLTSQSGEILTSRTNRLGYYTFTDLAAGETYIFNVFSKRYQFNPQVVNLTEDLAELDFSAQ